MSKQKKQQFNPIIQTTYDYAKFRILKGNRQVNQIHLRRLKQSIQSNPLVTLIMVNERMEIIDGQHRFFVSKELGLPINYVLVYGYGVKEVQILNANMNNWNKQDYLSAFIKLGNEQYIDFKEFRDYFKDLNFGICVKLANGLASHRTKRENGVKFTMKDFEQGNFKFKDKEVAYRVANMIMDFKPYFSKFSDNSFCLTLMSVFNHPNYDHKNMIHKLSIQPSALISCKTQEQYRIKLEEIFNFKSKTKVSLKY
jgi:hypothetical protein